MIIGYLDPWGKDEGTWFQALASGFGGSESGEHGVPIGPKVVPFWGSYLEFYKVIPKRNYFGAYG